MNEQQQQQHSYCCCGLVISTTAPEKTTQALFHFAARKMRTIKPSATPFYIFPFSLPTIARFLLKSSLCLPPYVTIGHYRPLTYQSTCSFISRCETFRVGDFLHDYPIAVTGLEVAWPGYPTGASIRQIWCYKWVGALLSFQIFRYASWKPTDENFAPISPHPSSLLRDGGCGEKEQKFRRKRPNATLS